MAIVYLTGLGGVHHSEALPGAVPELQNNPRRAPYGLFAEQLNGAGFTVPRARNLRSWLYRIRPWVTHGELEPIDGGRFSLDYLEAAPTPRLEAWTPRTMPEPDAVDFLEGVWTVAGAGDPASARGLAFHTFCAGASMSDSALVNADGDLMILPDTGSLLLRTELGMLEVAPGELCVVPRGMAFSIAPIDGPARGYAMEIYAQHFELPERGPIGSNGLADPRHFCIPVASWEDRAVDGGFRIVVKHGGRLYQARRSHSPFDVVGWHGNYVPFKYDLSQYNAMGTVGWDHPDPSIWTVLSAPLDHPGENLADLIVFPKPRWDVAQHTLRPPYYHRNASSELNAIVRGPSQPDEVFSRGGLFLTPPFAGHGASAEAIERALAMSDADADKPVFHDASSLWIQFESTLPLRVAPWASAMGVAGFRGRASAITAKFDPTMR